MVDLESAVRYPTQKEHWKSTLAAGGSILFGSQALALLGSLVLIPLIFLSPVVGIVAAIIGLPVIGYYVDVIRSTIDGEDEPPLFEGIKARIKDGLAVVGIAIAYLIPLVLIVLGSLFIAWLLSTASDDSALLALIAPLLAVPVGGLYSLLATYLLPISVSLYADDGLPAVFSPGAYRSIATDRSYASRWVVAVFAWTIGGLMAQWLYILVIGFFLLFYVQMVAVRQIGLGYAAAVSDGESTASETTDTDDATAV